MRHTIKGPVKNPHGAEKDTESATDTKCCPYSQADTSDRAGFRSGNKADCSDSGDGSENNYFRSHCRGMGGGDYDFDGLCHWPARRFCIWDFCRGYLEYQSGDPCAAVVETLDTKLPSKTSRILLPTIGRKSHRTMALPWYSGRRYSRAFPHGLPDMKQEHPSPR